jgi:HEAT repeat protein
LMKEPEVFLQSGDPVLRRMAVSAMAPGHGCGNLEAMSTDPDPSVRAAVAEKLGWCEEGDADKLEMMQEDPEPTVREAVATAYGQFGDASAVGWLVQTAGDDSDRQVREAAVAALGAIGDNTAIDPLLDFVAAGPPQVRRRAIAAITVFDDDRIEPALQRAALDRNPGVREAAEMVVGRQIVEGSA